MLNKKKLATAGVVVVTTIALAAGPAAAHECINASKNANNPAAGAQIVFGEGDDPLYITKGLQNRIERGIVDPEDGSGFHGIVAFDIDGDGIADGHTFLVGPDAEIPDQAQMNGPACKGITNIDVYFEECLD